MIYGTSALFRSLSSCHGRFRHVSFPPSSVENVSTLVSSPAFLARARTHTHTCTQLICADELGELVSLSDPALSLSVSLADSKNTHVREKKKHFLIF